jgi:hypothetical protein
MVTRARATVLRHLAQKGDRSWRTSKPAEQRQACIDAQQGESRQNVGPL